MPSERTSLPPEHDRLTELAERAVEDLARRLAEEEFVPLRRGARRLVDARTGSTRAAPRGPAHPQTAEGRAVEPLARLHALSYLLRAVDSCAMQAASAAARQGAGYPELGSAWGITRQGARRRWPGLVFVADQPTRPLPARTSRSASVNALMPDRSYHVLLVEDDAADALLIEEAMNDKGMVRSIARATDGITALEYLRSPDNPRPDLIVLDLNMPRMNGRELLGVLKDDPQLGPIPVVVLTTSSTPDDITAAYSRHANAYVTKPVNLDDFLQAVRRIDEFFLETATVPSREEE
ncbi:response regulator [Streptomyces sp. NBC_00448]|uniref:response regulator n=1 Tax=Streptomyces sp. NBC_00448 TaxID=2903652 RepID=UPI002E2227D8